MSQTRHFLTAIGRQVAPLAIGIVIGALCLYQGHREKKYKHRRYAEAFPFSHYPMYSGFDDFDYVMFIGKPDGTPLMIESLTNGFKANALKKRFDNLIDRLKDENGKGIRNRDATPAQMRPSGEDVLRWLTESFPGVAHEVENGGVDLYQVRIEVKDGMVVESAPIFIARIGSDAAPPQL